MRARKVQINASDSSQPERFKTAREAQEAADECNVHGEIHPVIVGCCGPRFYVLLVDDGEVIKYYSELSEAWFPVSGEVAKIETEEPELQEDGAEKQAPVFKVGKKYYTRTFSGRRNAGADITVVSITEKFIKFYDPATGGITKRKIKTGEGYQHFTCDYGRYGSYTTSWFEVGDTEDVLDAE